MQIADPPLLSFDPFFMDDGESAEKNEKNSPIFIFRIIVKNSSKIGVMPSQKWP